MTNPEFFRHDYEPLQEEIREIHGKVQVSLETNPRLNVRERSADMGFRRDFRYTLISGLEVQLLLGDSEYDEIGVESRITPDDPSDPYWIRIDLQTHGNEGIENVFEYMVDFGMKRFNQWTVSKRLPVFDLGDHPSDTYDDMTEAQIELYDRMEQDATSITADDINLLQRLAESLSQ